MTETVRVTEKRPTGSGRRVGWNKVVTEIDTTRQGGYAFRGRFLDERQTDLVVGSVVVSQIPVGSARSGHHWRVGIVTAAGSVEWEQRTWPLSRFLDFRDHVQTLLDSPADDIEKLRAERALLLRQVEDIDRRIERTERGYRERTGWSSGWRRGNGACEDGPRTWVGAMAIAATV